MQHCSRQRRHHLRHTTTNSAAQAATINRESSLTAVEDFQANVAGSNFTQRSHSISACPLSPASAISAAGLPTLIFSANQVGSFFLVSRRYS